MNTQDLLSPATQRPRPVVSFPASQSLLAAAAPRPSAISTGLARLDDAVFPPSTEEDSNPNCRGIPQGHVTEVFGPPGVGKTALALSIASSTLCAGGKVIWIDTGSPLPQPRLRSLLLKSIQSSESSQTPEEIAKNITHFRAQSLPHLLALLFHPPTDFPADGSTLLVVDSASGPFPSYFPNPTELKSRMAQSRTTDRPQIQWLMNRSSNVTSDLATQLIKLATTHNMAVLIINQTRTRIKGQPRATLCPVLAGASWESSVYTRIVLYRDFQLTDEDALTNIRFAEVMKRSGKILAVRLEENIVPFVIEADGLRGLDQHQSPSIAAKDLHKDSSLTKQKKRKVDEIADSQDEDDSDAEYGWTEPDDASLLED